MVQSQLTLLLLRPSRLSFSVVAAVTAVIVGAANWSYFTYDAHVYDFFYGASGIVTALEHSPDALGALQNGFVESPIINSIGILFFAVLAAMAVFVGIRGIEHGVGALRLLNTGTDADRQERMQHLKIRGAVLGLWAFYALFSINIALPFCLLLSRIGAEDFTTFAGAATSICATLLFALVVHVHIIFARLFCLRPRVFGGTTAIEDAFL